MISWTVLKDTGPFALPTESSDVLGVVQAPDREAARRIAEQCHGRDVLVVQARLWPATTPAPTSGPRTRERR